MKHVGLFSVYNLVYMYRKKEYSPRTLITLTQ